jgi:hypothetical protein
MTAWQALNISVNGAPTNVTLTGSVAENSAGGTFVGTLAGIDPDTAEGVAAPSTFQLLNDAGGRYRLESAGSNRLVVNNGGAVLFDFEAANRDALHMITVRVTDAGGLFVDRNIVVGVTNVNEAPNAPGDGATVWSFFDETGLGANPATGGAVVATFSLSDPDGTTPTMRIVPNAGINEQWFTIVGNQVRFTPSINLDYEWFRSQGYGIYDWNGDGRLDAHIANIYVDANDSALYSGATLLQVFISDVNERPNNLILEASNLFSETLVGDTAHAGQLIARFTMADPDGPSPNLVILGGNDNGWFTTAGGNHLAFAGPNFTADWLRATLGQYGQDAGFYYDTDGDGLKEVRVATLTLTAQDASGALSDPFAYNVLIEDRNEAPVWSADPFLFSPSENPVSYQYVGTVSGSDIDGPVSELRYGFSNWDRYYDSTLSAYVTRTSDQKFVMTEAGAVYVNGVQTMDFDAGVRNFSYQTIVYDRALGANTAYTYGMMNINLQDVNEPHMLTNAARSRAEGSYTKVR